MLTRYKIRQHALAEWQKQNGDLRSLLGGIQSLAYDIVIEGNKRANQELVISVGLQEDGSYKPTPKEQLLPTSAAAIPILLILQVVQILVWLYIQWSNHKSLPQENGPLASWEELQVLRFCKDYAAAAGDYNLAKGISLDMEALEDKTWGTEGSDGGHIQPRKPE